MTVSSGFSYMNPRMRTHSSAILKGQVSPVQVHRGNLHCSLPLQPDPPKLLIMCFPTLALIYLLIPCTFANGCHQGKDNIGCPTAIGTDVFTTAIADFCNNHFLVPNSLPTTVSINVGNSWPGLVYSLPIYEDEFGTDVSLWGTVTREASPHASHMLIVRRAPDSQFPRR